MTTKDRIKADLAYYEEALNNPEGRKAMDCKTNYGRSWRKHVAEEIEQLKKMLSDLENT